MWETPKVFGVFQGLARPARHFHGLPHPRATSLAEMERELTVERTRARFEVARQLGPKGGRKRQITESKINSAKKLLASIVPPRDVAGNSASPFRRRTGGFPPPPILRARQIIKASISIELNIRAERMRLRGPTEPHYS